jgi:hypothetical protein
MYVESTELTALISPTRYRAMSRTWVPMSPSAPDPAIDLWNRHDSGASGSALQSWRYVPRKFRTRPSAPSSRYLFASATAGVRR